MRTCSDCGAPLQEGARFCGSCGLSQIGAGPAEPLVGKVFNGKYRVLSRIGAGGMGGGDIATVAGLGANIVALCDVDEARAGRSFQNFPDARRYKDFREMIDKEEANIDAVTVGTPDHIHAVAIGELDATDAGRGPG